MEQGWSTGDVKKALVAYIMMGNNASQTKRVERAANPAKAKEITSWLAEKQVKKSAQSGNPITLGRLAKAYAPVVLILRNLLREKIRVQIPTTSPLEQCDIAFLGYSSCNLCKESRDFVEKFGIVISKVAKPDASESDLRSRNEGFARIAEEGLKRDHAMKTLLDAKNHEKLDNALAILHVKRGVPKTPTAPTAPSRKPIEEEATPSMPAPAPAPEKKT